MKCCAWPHLGQITDTKTNINANEYGHVCIVVMLPCLLMPEYAKYNHHGKRAVPLSYYWTWARLVSGRVGSLLGAGSYYLATLPSHGVVVRYVDSTSRTMFSKPISQMSYLRCPISEVLSQMSYL